LDGGYRPEPFPSDRHRVEYLFALYEQLTTPLSNPGRGSVETPEGDRGPHTKTPIDL
jgi:hypothetical protein